MHAKIATEMFAEMIRHDPERMIKRIPLPHWIEEDHLRKADRAEELAPTFTAMVNCVELLESSESEQDLLRALDRFVEVHDNDIRAKWKANHVLWQSLKSVMCDLDPYLPMMSTDEK